MTNYSAGAALERSVMEWAEATYDCEAFRSSGSHGKGDVILVPTLTLNDNRKRLPLESPVIIQVKRTKDKKKSEWETWKAWRPVGFSRWWISKAKGVKFEDKKIEVL
jgi:hypothetical protein